KINEDPIEFKEEPVDNFDEINQEEPVLDVSLFGIMADLMSHFSTATRTRNAPLKNVQHKCVVCLQKGNASEMRYFTRDPKRRGTWINAVRSTSEGRKVLMKLLNTSTNRFLCASHFDPSDFIYHPTRVALKSNAVPFFEVSISS
ncbi:hypothetical protein PMAYCL1PPCAC_01512, partial [Pristionchus mayeri]